MERVRSRFLALSVTVSLILVFFTGIGRADDGAAGGPEMSLLCISECGTCPTICTSPPPPTSPSSPSPPASPSSSPPPSPKSPTPSSLPPPSPSLPPPSPRNSGGSSPDAPSHSSSPPSIPSEQARGGLSNPYYYFYTAGSTHTCSVSSIYTLLFLVFLFLTLLR